MCSQNSRSCRGPLGVKTASHLGWLQGRWSFIGLTLGLTLFTTKRKLACKIYNSDSIWVWSVNDFVVDGSLEKAAQGHRAWGQPWSRAPECEGAEGDGVISDPCLPDGELRLTALRWEERCPALVRSGACTVSQECSWFCSGWEYFYSYSQLTFYQLIVYRDFFFFY